MGPEPTERNEAMRSICLYLVWTLATAAPAAHAEDGAPALGGHDPVAYYPMGGGVARLGKAKFSAVHDGATYHFVSAKNRGSFRAAPATFLPAYGGHGAEALAAGKRAQGDPAIFRVRGPTLFLFASSAARDRWLAAEHARVKAANANWKGRRAPVEAGGRAPKHWNVKGGLALQGFDPVAYFPEGGNKPGPGDKGRTYRYGGVEYRFASDKNREQFKTNPERYEPAYGGWCAYAVGKTGKKVRIDPRAYRIENGKLLVFYRTKKFDTRKPWRKDVATLAPKADANWKRISGE